jgi:TonB family protein
LSQHKAFVVLAAFYAVIGLAQAEAGRIRLVRLYNPVYPPLARQANITGTVVVEVIVRPDGSTQTSVVSGHPMLREAALTSARQSLFDCQICDAQRTYSLVYAFKQATDGDCCSAFSVAPTVQQGAQTKNAEGQEQTEIAIVAQQVCLCDPASTLKKPVRSLKCLYLWKCGVRCKGPDCR